MNGPNLQPGQPPLEQPPLIELAGVRRVFAQGGEEIQVLKGISLRINSGEFVAIIGQSGSGKTTLMNILGCLDRPSAGTYRVKGRDVAGLDADELSRFRREVFGFVFQRYNLLSGLGARENVEMPALYDGMPLEERQRRAGELLGRLGLAERLNYLPSQLSGGQQQRVSIARALMNGGEIILADEPTGALDSGSGNEVLNLLEELHGAGHTVILITHDASVAARARRTIALSDGEVLSDGANTGPARVDEADGTEGAAGAANPATPADLAGSRAAPQAFQLRLLRQGQSLAGSLAPSLGTALRSLKDNRLRTMLTLLGIIVGVASVVAMLALGNGAKAKVLASIESMGSDLIMIRPNPGSSRSTAGSTQITEEDIEVLQELPGVMGAVGENNGSVSVRFQESDYLTSFTATGVAKPMVANWQVNSGEFFNEHDAATSGAVVVLGQTVADNIFPPGYDPVGAYVLIRNMPFLVLGVMEKKGASAFGSDQDDVLLLPLGTARLRLQGRNYLGNVIVRGQAGQDMLALQERIQQAMEARHPNAEFRIFNTSSIMEAASASQDTLTTLLGSVAAISLLVGGIGVMNIMLVSVVERTREIGIRMACGARQRDILVQFITEALLVCIIGGLSGVALGLLVTFAAQLQGAPVLYTLPPVLLALGCSLATGMIFGFTPARKAARLDPVLALASE
ncbi:MAG: MacB family efflux pump subunit [Deltaproteobacteria bacterium]|jgi:macrolide transport system ATP-binding/permease protein|nr:MacB family efflux pump subunit [Deltaproteobacteria bacterium]